MTAIETILNRCSSPKLLEPAPNEEEVKSLLACGLAAPDHGRLKPWRFIVLAERGLRELGEVFLRASQADDPDLSEAKRQRALQMPYRAPMIIVAIAKVDAGHPKVPAWEQVAAVSAAVQNISLAATEMGYGHMWRTGAMTSHPIVREYFALEQDDELVAFLYVGTRGPDAKRPPHVVEFEEHVEWR